MELIYARWLDWGARSALGVLVACFALYALGLLEPLVPLRELPRLWALPVDRFVAATGAPTGWGWLGHLARGDYLNLAGVAALCLITVICYARVFPLLLKTDRLYAALCAAQIVVLLIAASGFLGGHG